MGRYVTGIRLAGFGAAYMFAAGAFMSYWPVWLHERGITDAQIGTLYMTRQVVGIVAMLGIGFLAHRVGRLRGILLVLAIGATVLMGAYQVSYSFIALLLVGLVWGWIWSPVLALYDGVLVNEAKARDFTYGRLRMWGSVAFIAGTLICGVAVDHFGPPAVLYVSWVGVFCLMPLALVLPGSGRAQGARSHAPFHVRDLLSSPPFVLFLIAAGLCQASHAVLYSFGTLTWRAAGIDDVTISLLWGESVAVEILMMMASGWVMQRIGITGLIGLGLGCGIVRWTGMAFTTELPALVILQALHAATFAACHLGAMAFIQRTLPPSGTALGQSLYYALGTGTAQAVIYQFAGVLYSEYGQRAFLGMTAISATGLVALVALTRSWTGELLVGGQSRSNMTGPAPGPSA
jgi:MFS transporter, PPP family, 3-phenylpropionic acid transporter